MGLHMAMLSPAPAASDLDIYASSGIILLSPASALRPQIVTAAASTGDGDGRKKLGTSVAKDYTLAPSKLPPVRMTRNIAAFMGAPTLAGHAVVSLGCTLNAVVSQPSIYTSALTRLVSHMHLDNEVSEDAATCYHTPVSLGTSSDSAVISGVRDFLATQVLGNLAALAPSSHVAQVASDACSAEAETVGCVDDALYRLLTESSEERAIANTNPSWQGYC